MPDAYRPARCAGRDPERRGAVDGQVGVTLDGDRGAVTVEAALAVCSLVTVMTLAVGAVAAASAHLRCLDAAREAARLVARGEPDRAREIAAAVAPRNARIVVSVIGDEVQVDVSTAVVPGLPGLSLDARAVGVLEPAALVGAGGTTHPGPQAPGDSTSAASGPRATEEDRASLPVAEPASPGGSG